MNVKCSLVSFGCQHRDSTPVDSCHSVTYLDRSPPDIKASNRSHCRLCASLASAMQSLLHHFRHAGIVNCSGSSDHPLGTPAQNGASGTKRDTTELRAIATAGKNRGQKRWPRKRRKKKLPSRSADCQFRRKQIELNIGIHRKAT